MLLLDLLGRRWALRVLWELREEPATFRELRGRCDGVSPTVLNDRLRELRDAGILDWSADTGYGPSKSGRGLAEKLLALNAWANRWADGKRKGE